jgi:hypothetical protein
MAEGEVGGKTKMTKCNKIQLQNRKIEALNFCIQRGDSVKRIFKLILSQNSPDFYITFPDFQSSEFHCEVMIIPQGESRLENFNAKQNAIKSLSIPVKFSYHLSGIVNFKPTSPQRINLPLSFKLNQIQATPIEKLDGEHIFTIQFEGLEKFKDFLSKKKNEFNSVAVVPENRIFFKIVGFGGFEEKKVLNKYNNIPCLMVKMMRKNLKKPFLLAIYLLASSKSIQKENKKHPFLLALVGFKKEYISLNKEFKSLYLYAV